MSYVIPPGTQKNPKTAFIKITLQPLYLNNLQSQMSFQLVLWGRSQPIYFIKNQCQLDVHTSLSLLTDYLSDMNILNIQCFSSKSHRKIIGSAYVSLKRYLIENLINDFIQNVIIVDSNKRKVGQLSVQFKLEVLEVVKQQQIIWPIKAINKSSYSPKQGKKYEIQNKNFNLPQLLNSRQTFRSQEGQVKSQEDKKQMIRLKKDDLNEEIFQQQFIKQKKTVDWRIDNKHQPSLSEIMRKYPKNKPCLQIMQLRMDELQFLSENNKNKHNGIFDDKSQLKIYFNRLKVWQGKVKLAYLKISQEYDGKIIQTTIPLKEGILNQYNLNFVCLIQKFTQDSKILFQTAQCKAEITISDIIKSRSIQLKKKDSTKKYAEIYFKSFTQIKQQQIQDKAQRIGQSTNKLIIVQDDGCYDVEINGKGFETVRGNMVIYTTLQSDNQDILTVKLSNKNIIKDELIIKPNQIYKQQLLTNKENKKIKIISAKGQINYLMKISQERMSKLNKIDQQKFGENNTQDETKYNNKLTRSKSLQILLQSFNLLQICENNECKQIVDFLIDNENEALLNENFPKLVKQANLHPDTFEAFIILMHKQFSLFWATFIQFSIWNSKYKRALIRLKKRINESMSIIKLPKYLRKKHTIFGMISVGEVQDELMRHQVTEEVTQQFKTLLMRSNKQQTIKISDIQQLTRQTNNLWLNGCMMIRIYSTIVSDESLCELVKSIHQKGDINNNPLNNLLVKLLNDYQLIDQTISDINLQDHNLTQRQIPKRTPLITEQQIHTEPIQEEIKPKIKIPLWINQIILDKKINKIRVNGDYLFQLQDIPIRLMLEQEQEHQIVIECQDDENLQGLFIMTNKLNKITLFQNGENQGYILVGNTFQNTNSQIEIPFTTKQQIKQQNIINHHNQDYQLGDILVQKVRATSDKIKIKVLNIGSLANNKIKIFIDSVMINYPQQNEVVLNNKNQSVAKILHTKYQLKQQIIHNFIGVNSYAFSQREGSEIRALLNIQISEYLGEQTLMVGKKVLICNILHIESLFKFMGNYKIQIQGTNQLKQFNKKQQTESRSLKLDYSSRLEAEKDDYNILLLRNKQLICCFRFKIKFNSEIGIFKHEGYLIDCGYRLSVCLYELNYNDIFWKQPKGQNKFERLFNIFQFPQLELIMKKMSQGEKVVNVLKDIIQFTHTQIDSLIKLSFDQKEFESLFHQKILGEGEYFIKSVEAAFQQFQLFDIHGSGLISMEKAKIVNKLVFNDKLNLEHFKLTNTSTLVDKYNQLNSQIISSNVDYILILWTLKHKLKCDNYFTIPNQNIQTNINKEKGLQTVKKQMEISLVSYKGLKMGKNPGNFIFKINNKQFAEPVLRSYSHEYSKPYPSIICDYPCILQIFHKEYGVKQLWTQIPLDRMQIQPQVNILGGKVFFQIKLPQKKTHKITQLNNSQRKQLNQPNSLLRETRIKHKQQSGEANDAKRIQSILNQKLDYSKFDNIDDE